MVEPRIGLLRLLPSRLQARPSKEECARSLQLLGVVDPLEVSGGIIQKQSAKPYRLVSARSCLTTPLARELRLTASESLRDRIVKEKALCIFRLRPECRVMTGWVDPITNIDVRESYLQNITFHIFSLSMEGDIGQDSENNGTEGQECKCVAPLFGACDPMTEGECKVVPGSADLTGRILNKVNSVDLGKEFFTSSKEYGTMHIGEKPTVTGHWSTGWWGEAIWNLITLLVTGTIHTYQGIDLNGNYEWRGDTHTWSKHVDIDAWLPVRGSLTWSWD